MFLFCLVFKSSNLGPLLSVGLTNTVVAEGLGCLSSQTQEIIISGLSEIGMANPMGRGVGVGRVSLFFFF